VCEQNAVIKCLMRRAGHSHVEGRVYQDLRGKPAALLVVQGQGRDGGEVGAGAIAPNRDVRWVDIQGGGVGDDPTGRRKRIVNRRREPVLRGKPVLDGDDGAGPCVRYGAAQRIVGRNAAERPAPAMEEDQRG
jgi:hypothetical protein